MTDRPPRKSAMTDRVHHHYLDLYATVLTTSLRDGEAHYSVIYDGDTQIYTVPTWYFFHERVASRREDHEDEDEIASAREASREQEPSHD